MDLGLNDRKAFVGGASRGIGKAIALELARDTKGYTKSIAMLVYSVALLLADWTSKPNTNLC